MKKRIISLMVTLSAITSVISVNAKNTEIKFSDISNTSEYFHSIINVSKLEIIEGYPDNTFVPYQNITRSEAVKMMVGVLGIDNPPKPEKAVFDDVSQEYWASGYISCGIAMGFINGIGNNCFAPESNVTYSQMIKMLICILGYNHLENISFPDGYVEKGKKLGITKDLILDKDVQLNRAQAAYLIDNALNIPICAVTGYEGTTITDENGKTEYIMKPVVEILNGNGQSGNYETLLSNYHDTEK